MRILTVGGGSGGHVTPIVAVLQEIQNQHPRAEIRFWCDKNFAPQARSIMREHDESIKTSTVVAGKFRRYHHLTKLQHLTIPSVVFPNIRDAFYVVFGILQSIMRLIMWRPDVVFAKGGHVCLPVGIAAWILRIPLVIHDSDAHPGLTNRALAPLAKRIATGVSLDHYNYPEAKSAYVGIPIDPRFKIMDVNERQRIKKSLGLDPRRPLIVFIGGGQGAKQINMAVANQLDGLLKLTNVVLVSGASQYDELRSLTPTDDPRFILQSFVSQGMAELLGAADIVATRAGATALLELAALAKPVIVIPSKRLTWQVKHVRLYVDMQAVYPLDEDLFDNPEDKSLIHAVERLLRDTELRQKLSKNLHRLARPHAARDLAVMIVNAARKQR